MNGPRSWQAFIAEWRFEPRTSNTLTTVSLSLSENKWWGCSSRGILEFLAQWAHMGYIMFFEDVTFFLWHGAFLGWKCSKSQLTLAMPPKLPTTDGLQLASSIWELKGQCMWNLCQHVSDIHWCRGQLAFWVLSAPLPWSARKNIIKMIHKQNKIQILIHQHRNI